MWEMRLELTFQVDFRVENKTDKKLCMDAYPFLHGNPYLPSQKVET